MKQRTLAREVSIKGNALHTGDAVHMTFKPAPANHGIVFRRVDLPQPVDIPVCAESVTDTRLASTISSGDAKVHTVEHLMSALAGLQVDNCVIEIDGPEVPAMEIGRAHV